MGITVTPPPSSSYVIVHIVSELNVAYKSLDVWDVMNDERFVDAARQWACAGSTTKRGDYSSKTV